MEEDGVFGIGVEEGGSGWLVAEEKKERGRGKASGQRSKQNLD